MRGWWSHVGGSEVSVSLSLHGSLHLLHHPQRNWERLQLVHPDVRTVPEHTQSSVTMATTDRHPCGDRGGDIVLTYIHHCETDPECPPRSAGRPDQTHTQMSHGAFRCNHIWCLWHCIALTIFPPVALMWCLSANHCLSFASAAYWYAHTHTHTFMCLCSFKEHSGVCVCHHLKQISMFDVDASSGPAHP